MKKINILLLIGLLAFVSCEEKLDLTPNDGLTDDQLFSTAQGYDDAAKGMYSGFRADGYYGEDVGIMICPDVMSDNLAFNTEGRQTQKDLFEWRNTAVDESWGLYERGYKIISRANNIIGNVKDGETNATILNAYGEALAVRALVHFDIARTYCKIPTQADYSASDMGIFYSKEYAPDSEPRRKGTTVAGVYDNVLADLSEALKYINENNGAGRLSKAAVYGIMARVNLFYGKYADAVSNADSVIARGFDVAPRDQVENIYYDEYDDNVLFKIRVTDQDRHRPGVPYSQEADGEIRSEYVVNYDFYTLYKADDIRLSATIVTSDFGKNTYNHIKKYLGRRTGDKTVIDGKYLRMEEVFLTKAEALLRNSGSEADALEALNKVRAARYENFTSPDESGSALLDAVMLERRLELAFEGDRFYTLKRLSMDCNRGTSGDLADGSGTAAIVQVYKAGEFRWQLPIPQGAFDANTALTDEDQNPGY